MKRLRHTTNGLTKSAVAQARTKSLRLYGAKLLFQFRVVVGRASGKRRICEERIIHVRARSAKAALRTAQKRGKSGEFDYLNSDGNRVFFEFVGVLDLLHLGPECDEGEVWYEIRERMQPMERKRRLIPDERRLAADVD